MVRGSGKVVYNDIEGGFYGIVSDNGERYVVDIPKEMQIDGLRISYILEINERAASYRMWGVHALVKLIMTDGYKK